MSRVTEAQILDALRHVQDPDLHQDIVSLGFVKDPKIDGGAVSVRINLTTPACPVKDQLKQEAEERLRAIPGVTSVAVEMTAVPIAPSGPAAQAGRGRAPHRGRLERQGRRRQEHRVGQPGRGAGADRRARRAARLRRLRPPTSR